MEIEKVKNDIAEQVRREEAILRFMIVCGKEYEHLALNERTSIIETALQYAKIGITPVKSIELAKEFGESGAEVIRSAIGFMR